jgi:hypothetical protein
MKSRRIICFTTAIVFAAIHFIVVGIPSIEHKGYGGEGLGLLYFFVDAPLFLLADYLFPFLLYSSVYFGFILFDKRQKGSGLRLTVNDFLLNF